ncbi:S8 family serine peptidase [Nonomuraea sp. NPDC046570]|uniref:S8 family serine peptidase n=1 Tax=Nonomuraea sp. NPDC046570 TaxID=3155255 RepID=UPI0033E05877
MIGRGVASVVLALLLAGVPGVGVAHAEPEQCDPPKGTMEAAESWAQRRFDVKNTVWRFTRGEGVTVAVVDSGIDLTHPQIRVAGKGDFTRTGHRDCVGHGTAVAGIIAALHYKDVLFHGVAPGVKLLSLKQTNSERGDVRLLARAIRAAAELDADVINVSAKANDHPDLRAAVEFALSKDVVIVAAAGNKTAEDGTPVRAYPASYEGVLSVGSATSDGRVADSSNPITPVSVLAPGQNLSSTWTGRAYQDGLEGTSYAAPYVTGVVALVRSRFPRLNQQQVRQRVIATAEGAVGKGSGAGMVNPLQAVTAILPFEAANAPVIAPPLPEPLPAGVVSRVPPVDRHAIDVALIVGAAALAAAGLAVAAKMLVPMGRRRGWRPGGAD